MSKQNVNFKVNTNIDLDDLFIRRALFTQGGLWLWGTNTSGQLGNNATASRSSPVQTVTGGTNWKSITCGYSYTAAIKTDGTLWLWGGNAFGQLGDNTTASKSSPVQTVSGGTNWISVSAGVSHAAAIKNDGTLWVWGENNYGQLGDNSRTSRSSPVQTVSTGTNWKYVSAGGYITAAIKTDGTLWTWGLNDVGQLGDNTTGNNTFTPISTLNSKSSPVQTISGGTNWKEVSTGQHHMAAIKTDGTLWTWGGNFVFDDPDFIYYGRLGTNNLTNYSSPVQTISGGSNWKQVSCAEFHTAAIKNDGTLWTWGVNTYGALGDNTSISKSSPVQTVSGGTNWRYVTAFGDAAVENGTAAIKTDGTLWLWGVNQTGQLGNNSITNRSSPVQTVSGGTSWKTVVGGGGHTAAIIENN